jgi:TonB-linked SusC/RagA family outer membrane protein
MITFYKDRECLTATTVFLRKVILRAGLLACILFLSQSLSFAQSGNRIITGTIYAVVDESPIPGANISVKGTSRGVTSDANGKYSIEASDNEVLVFSFIGYTPQEIKVGNSSKIDVKLVEEIQKLQEVVVVGYGSQKTRNISSSQTNIAEGELKRTVNTTIDQALQGRAPNVYVASNSGKPGGAASIYIRGISSINGNTQPMYVIDGVQIIPPNSTDVDGQSNILASLNPDDIESMNVLTGPSAQSIYGSKASNGVIVVTTKKGKAGEARINFTSSYNLQTLPKILPTMNLQEYAIYSNAWSDVAGYGRQAEFADPSILGEGTNWQKALFKTAAMLKQQLSISGGNDKTTYYLSAEILKQDGLAPNSGFNRKSFRFNIDNNLKSYLKIGANLSVSGTSEKLSISSDNIINTAIQQSPATPLYNGDGSWGGPQNITPSTPSYVWVTNPVALAYTNSDVYKRITSFGTIYADITPIKDLVFHTEFNGTFGNDTRAIFNPSYQFGKNNITQGAINAVTSSRRYASNSYYWSTNQRLTYSKYLEKHEFNITIGHEAQYSFYENLSGSVTGYTSNNIPELSAGDLKTSISGSTRDASSQESFFGRLGYIFDDKYILQASLRRDGSSNFGPNNKWGYFPSMSVAWRLSKESFMQSLSFINDFKIRAEMGTTGNQYYGKPVYASLTAVPTQTGTAFIAANFANPDLKWESTRSYDIGFDFFALRSRVQVVFDWYLRQTKNLITELPLPGYAGTTGQGSIGAPVVNIGNMENRGFGFSINTVPVQNKSITWKSGFNMSFDRNKLLKLNTDRAFVFRKPWFTDVISRSELGQPLWQFYSYKYAGIFQNYSELVSSPIPTNVPVGPNGAWVGDVKFTDVNGDNTIDDKDRTLIGNPWPKFTFGINNSVSYKNFDLSIFMQGTYGNQIFNQLKLSNSGFTNLIRGAYKEAINFARPSSYTVNDETTVLLNPGTQIPRIGSTPNANNRATDHFIEDGSYLRVKNVTLSYNFSKSLLKRYLPISGLKLTAGVQNLLTITKYSGYDPEVGNSAGLPGFDNGRYPSSRMYTFSLSADF